MIQYLSTPVPISYVQLPGQPPEPCATAILADQARCQGLLDCFAPECLGTYCMCLMC